MTRAWVKWMPAAAVPVLIAGAAIAAPLTANAAVSLPTKTPQQVIALIAGEKVAGFSGTVQQTSALGLPSIPSVLSGSGGGSGSSTESSALGLLTGPNTIRVFDGGTGKLRLQVLDNLAERDLVRNGSDVWIYSSKDKTATHAVLPAARPVSHPGSEPGFGATPDSLAATAIAAITKSTTVSVGPDLRVAGRTAYDLILTPNSSDSLVGSVSIAVDSSTGLPLQVDVSARGQKAPAVSVGFTSIDFSVPAASTFQFTAPAGTAVTQKTVAQKTGTAHHATGVSHAQQQADPKVRPTVSGSGWDSIVALPSSKATVKALSSPLVSKLTTPVSGGRLLHSALVNVFVTTDGRVFAGSVPLASLQAAAATQ